MKLAALTCLSLSILGFVQGLVTARSPSAFHGDYGHYATYVSPGSDEPFHIYEKGYAGPSSVVSLDLVSDSSGKGTFGPWINASSPSFLEDCSAVEVCKRVASCVTYAADSS